MPAESTGQFTKTVTTAASPGAVISIGSGRLNAYMITTPQAETITFYDSATTTIGSSVIIGYIATSPAVGAFQAWDIPYSKGILIVGSAGGTVMTVVYGVS